MILSQFTVFAASDTAVNVALNMQASASSERSAQNSADKANDGINDNESYTCYISADGDDTPWWQVDMGLSFPVSEIEIDARKGDADKSERMNFRVVGANKEDFTDSVVLGECVEDYGNKFRLEFAERKNVRYIKVEKTSNGPLSIGEITVLAEKEEILQGAEANSSGTVKSDANVVGVGEKLNDIAGKECEDAVLLLNALGIMNGYPDGSFIPENTVTRAEFAKIAAKIMGAEYADGSQTFTDVPTDYWAYNYIESMAVAGIIDGVGNNMFEPDADIDTNQTVKILVSLLGYKEIAEFDGGYPDGFLKIANRLKLFKGINNIGENITRGQIAMVVGNAIDADLFRQDTFGEKSSGSKVEGETIISENLNIFKDEGVITAVRGTSLTNANDEKDGTYLEISDKEYKSEITNLKDYLGLYVKFYYLKQGNEPYKILAVMPETFNRILEIDADDIISASSSEVKYYDGDKEKYAKIAGSTTDVIYNGFALRDYIDDDLMPQDGKIKLIDNDYDGRYDVYIVNKIDTYIANRVNSAKNAISVKDTAKYFEFSESRDIVSFTNAATGMEAQLSDINEWDVLSVIESKEDHGSKYYDILISDEKISGTLEAIEEDYIIIDGEEYDTASIFEFADVTVGDSGTFLIDAYGRVCGYDGITEKEGEYGFLRAIGEGSDLWSASVKFRIYTKDGTFETLETGNKKLVIDNIQMNSLSQVEQHLKNNNYIIDSVAQPIKFVRGPKNTIKSIDTVYQGVDEEDGLKQNSAAQARYWKNTGVMTVVATGAGQVAVNNDTVMMRIPQNIDKEDDYEMVSTASLTSDSQYTCAVYDCRNDKVAELMVFSGTDKGEVISANRVMLVEKSTLSVNEDGETITKIYGLYHGNKVVFEEKESGTISLSDVKYGDIITLSLTAGNLIKGYNKVWYPNGIPADVTDKAVSPDAPFASTSGVNDEVAFVYGRVLTMNGDIITVGPEDGEAYESVVVNLNSPELKIYRIDSENGKVDIASPEDVFDVESAGIGGGSKVFVRFSCRMEYELIIFD